jgi:transcriptional regulator GlxA family with amidase domain
LQRRKTRTKRPELGAALVAAFCLAGCGSGSEHRVAPQPQLPAPVASALASRSDEVAQALAGGDQCRALSLAQQLQQETIAAINARRVPRAFQEQLGSTVADLVSRIRCVPAVKPPESDKHKSKKKHEKDD